jgi:Trypsin-like peptidase domain
MPWSWEWAVQIGRDEGRKLLGSGTVIAPGRVLTARHVVYDKAGQPKQGLVVRRDGGTWSPSATVKWAGAGKLDAAVLEVAIDGPAPSPLALLSPRDVGDESWTARGYPVVDPERPRVEREPVRGTTCPYQRGDHDLSLDIGARPDDQRGFSGAAVVAGGHVVGVLRAVPDNWGNGRVKATPVAALLQERGFRDALGLHAEDERLAKDLIKLEAAVAARLQALPLVAAWLAGKLGLDPAPADCAASVARVLVHGKAGRDVMKALNEVDEELKEDATRVGERRAIEGLTWQLLPFATDWQAWVLKGRSELAHGATFVDLPLGTETIAEAVLAGIDCRPCRYKADGRPGPSGGAILHEPAAAAAPFLDPDGHRFAEATVGLLAVSFFGLAPDAPDLRNYARVRQRVNGALEYYRFDAVGDERLPRWLLLDAELPGGPERGGERTTMAVAVLGKELPHLRILRLSEEFKDETILALHVGRMWRERVRGG